MFNRGDKIKFKNGGMYTFLITDICNDACQIQDSVTFEPIWLNGSNWFPMVDFELWTGSIIHCK